MASTARQRRAAAGTAGLHFGHWSAACRRSLCLTQGEPSKSKEQWQTKASSLVSQPGSAPAQPPERLQPWDDPWTHACSAPGRAEGPALPAPRQPPLPARRRRRRAVQESRSYNRNWKSRVRPSSCIDKVASNPLPLVLPHAHSNAAFPFVARSPSPRRHPAGRHRAPRAPRRDHEGRQGRVCACASGSLVRPCCPLGRCAARYCAAALLRCRIGASALSAPLL